MVSETLIQAIFNMERYKYTDVLSLNSIESSAHQLTEECFAILPTDD